MRGYRGFARELSRTGSWRALVLQVRTGIFHVLRRLRRRPSADPVALFLANYAADGVRPAPAREAELRLRAQACLVCGLCSAECARVGGHPPLDPRDAVIAASRLEIDLLRFDLAAEVAGTCAGCRACDAVCPAGIPIHRVQARLDGLGAPAARSPGAVEATADPNSRTIPESATSPSR